MSDTGIFPLHQAAGKGDIPAIRRLLAAGTDIESRTADGSTPLHYAIWSRHSPTIQVFLDAGANANIRDSEGRRPVDIADAEGLTKDEQYHRLVELSRH